jgi:hypothetical protein
MFLGRCYKLETETILVLYFCSEKFVEDLLNLKRGVNMCIAVKKYEL